MPAYLLSEIQAKIKTVNDLKMSHTARLNASELGIFEQDVIEIINRLESKEFYKSMTSYVDHRIWQDVYRTQWRGILLYLKFAVDLNGFIIISLKKL